MEIEEGVIRRGTNSRCLFYRGVRLIESQIEGVKKGRDQLYSKCPFCRGVRLTEVPIKRKCLTLLFSFTDFIK